MPFSPPTPLSFPVAEQPTLACLGDTLGKLSEVLLPSGGMGLVLEQLLREQREKQEYLALVDATNAFDPATVEEPCLLDHLLWVRCNGLKTALRCADVLLRDQNFPVVLMDLLDIPLREIKRLPLHQWYRLQHLCKADNRGIIFTREMCIPAAQYRIRIEGTFTLKDLDYSRSRICEKLQTEIIKQAGGTTGFRMISRRGDQIIELSS